jgi:hypothetical protein
VPEEVEKKRRARRAKVLGHALILGAGVRANCVLRDISVAGAKIGISARVKLPRTFDLVSVKTQSRRRVYLRWRRGDFAGVEFCQRVADIATERPENKEVWVV